VSGEEWLGEPLWSPAATLTAQKVQITSKSTFSSKQWLCLKIPRIVRAICAVFSLMNLMQQKNCAYHKSIAFNMIALMNTKEEN